MQIYLQQAAELQTDCLHEAFVCVNIVILVIAFPDSVLRFLNGSVNCILVSC